MKLVEFVTSKLIVEAFSNKVIRFGLVFHWFSTKSPRSEIEQQLDNCEGLKNAFNKVRVLN
jgi:hypothetical protein